METVARTTVDAPGPNPAPDRCTARARRIAAIKFVALPLEHQPDVEADLPVRAGRPSILRRLFQFLSSFRASGRLEAARP